MSEYSKMGGDLGFGSPDSKVIKDWHKPEGCYSQKYTQAPTKYVSRQNDIQEKAAGKIRSNSYNGRYS